MQIQKAVVVPKALYYYVQRGGSIMNDKQNIASLRCCRGGTAVLGLSCGKRCIRCTGKCSAKFTMGSVSRVYRQLPPALRKAPRSREMLRMQFEVVRPHPAVLYRSGRALAAKLAAVALPADIQSVYGNMKG